LGSGTGCIHSLATGGKLVATGNPSLAADTLTLLGSQMPNGSVLYFQGTTQLAGGLGITFGDGLRCAGGAVARLGTKINASGASQYPIGLDPTISVQGGVTTPGTRYYQAWYRDSFPYCTPALYDMTNALQVIWGP
jgi:hypothetical protein